MTLVITRKHDRKKAGPDPALLPRDGRKKYSEWTMAVIFARRKIPMVLLLSLLPLALGILESGPAAAGAPPEERPRIREFGIRIGVLDPGPLNAITDVAGVRVGQVTLIKGPGIRTGVTAVVPHGGNLFQEKVPAGVSVGNGYGKLTGFTQVEELGTLETPIVLTNTLSVPTAADALIDDALGRPGNEGVTSVNPVVGETNDGWLNDIRGRHVTKADVLEAVHNAAGGPVAEGSVGAGTGTICLGFKGGIGTASRRLAASRGGYTVGVLVQTNFGGVLTVDGVSAGRILREENEGAPPSAKDGALGPEGRGEGSCMIVVATDAPLDARDLKRLAKRALLGIARTGGYFANGSGDYAIAFSTDRGLRVPPRAQDPTRTVTLLRDENVSPLFEAAAEAAEEAILDSLFKSGPMEGRDGHRAEALPLEKIRALLAGRGGRQ
jgi:D-aminopeptidase